MKRFLEQPKIWLLKKPLNGLNDSSRQFGLKVRKVFEGTGMKRLPGYEDFYYCQYEKGVIEGMI